MHLGFSRNLAWGLGVFFPVIETWRRWGEFGQPDQWSSIFDDYLMGGLLLAGVFLSARRPGAGRRLLIGAWGVACGIMYESFFGQLGHIGDDDPSGAPQNLVLCVKAILFGLCILGFIGALVYNKDDSAQ